MARELVNDHIKGFCYDYGYDYREMWNILYKAFLHTFHVNLKVRARNRKLSAIAYAEQNGFINQLLGLSLVKFNFNEVA